MQPDDDLQPVDLTLCRYCVPDQMFMLSRKYDSEGTVKSTAVDSILVDTFLEPERTISVADDLENGRVRLFEMNLTASPVVYNMQSLSVIRHPTHSDKLLMFLASEDVNQTVILTYSIELSSKLSEAMVNVRTRGNLMSLLILIALILVVAVPLLARFHPRLRAMIDDWHWKRQSEKLGIETSPFPKRTRVDVNSPLLVGKRNPAIVTEETQSDLAANVTN